MLRWSECCTGDMEVIISVETMYDLYAVEATCLSQFPVGKEGGEQRFTPLVFSGCSGAGGGCGAAYCLII